jgi:hypothetical protein
MLKTIKPMQTEKKKFHELRAGMITADGVIIFVDFRNHILRFPLGPVGVPPDEDVPVLAQVTPEMVEEISEAVYRERTPGVRS